MAVDAKKIATNQKYLDKLDRITLRVWSDGSDGVTREQLHQIAAAEGTSVNAWILDAILRKLAAGHGDG